MTGFPHVPRSACSGIAWPAPTGELASRLLALQYQFEQTQWWPEERLRALQLQQFNQVLRHALATVPYYRERFPHVNGDLGWREYGELPVSSRREIQLAGNTLHSGAPPQSHGAVVSTQSSGSTASPLVTLGTAWTQLLWHSLLLRDHVWHGRDLRGKLAAIRSKTDDGEAPSWGVATSPFITGPSAVRSLTVDIDEQLDWLVGENPDYLLTLATNLRELAQRSHERGLRLPRLKQARSFGEMLQPDARNVVRRAWGVVIADSYSSEELGYIALQCPRHEQHYHLQSESLIVEVLDAGGRPCRPGEVGQVTVSTLHNFAMPLLRYASGDYAEVGEPCPCGRGLPVLTRIAGRQRNMLRRPDGVRHWPSFPISAWADTAPVRQIQLVQDAIDHVEARVVMPRDFAGDERALLEQALIRTLGYPFRMTVTRVDSIPRGAGQKYEDFVSLID